MHFIRALQLLLLSFFLSSSTQAEYQLNLTPGVTPISHEIYYLHMTILTVCAVIGIIVFSTMFYSIIYHRKSLGAKAMHFHEHLWLEIAWSILPLLILVGMAIPATVVLIHLNDPAQPELTIKITGFQWKWRYEYLEDQVKFFSNNATPISQIQGKTPKNKDYLRTVDHPLVVPIHKKIRFLLTSNDVIHSWWVPELGVKRDAVPGFINESWTRINRPGLYHGQCAELCGINHAYMPIVVMAVSEKEYNDWLAKQKGIIVAPTSPQPASVTTQPTTTTPLPTTTTTKSFTREELVKRGEQIYLSICAACHQPSGEGIPPTFPALKGSKIVNGKILDHIHIVLNGEEGTAMQAFRDQLSAEDIAAVITYERNALGNSQGDMVQPAEIEAAKNKS